MGNGKIIKLGFILIIIIVSLFISFGCRSAEDDVEIGYEVTVTVVAPSVCLVDIIYSDADGRIVQVQQDIFGFTWETSFTVPSDEVTDFLVFLSARHCSNVLITDTITVTIRKDGLLFLTKTGVGANIDVSVSGNL